MQIKNKASARIETANKVQTLLKMKKGLNYITGKAVIANNGDNVNEERMVEFFSVFELLNILNNCLENEIYTSPKAQSNSNNIVIQDSYENLINYRKGVQNIIKVVTLSYDDLEGITESLETCYVLLEALQKAELKSLCEFDPPEDKSCNIGFS